MNNRWGISLKQIITKTATNKETGAWFFADGPRWMRAKSLEKIPELLDELAKEADRQRAMIEGKLQFAQELASLVKGATK